MANKFNPYDLLFGVTELKCKVCGKTFYATNEWVYKVHSKDRTYKVKVCSWSCQRKAEKDYMDRRKKGGKKNETN